MSNPKVVFEPVPSRWRVENRVIGCKWVVDQCFPTLEEATAYAQKWLDNNPDSYAYRVVDTRPEDDTQPDTGHMGDGTPLTLDTYQQQAKATAVYPAYASFHYLIAGLAGEVGEVSSIFAKHWREDGPLTRDNLEAELGDVLWFVAMLAHEIGCNLSDVAQRNLTKLADRQQRGKLKGNGDNR